jgi:transposase
VLLPCGRKPREISKEERQLVIKTHKEYGLGACNLQAILEEEGIHIPHNRIHRILREGIAKPQMKKQEEKEMDKI